MAKNARRVARRIPWQDELTIPQVQQIISHFTACEVTYRQAQTEGVRDWSADIARAARCVAVWTDALALKHAGQSIVSTVAPLRLNAPENAMHG